MVKQRCGDCRRAECAWLNMRSCPQSTQFTSDKGCPLFQLWQLPLCYVSGVKNGF
jgi:hypothetical protein